MRYFYMLFILGIAALSQGFLALSVPRKQDDWEKALEDSTNDLENLRKLAKKHDSNGGCVPLRDYMEVLRETDSHLLAIQHAGDKALLEERDRRYAEVNVEKEKALKIKETADLAALQLAREIQTYKDEKANELREQISSERGLYVTKNDLASAIARLEAVIAPLTDYMARNQGLDSGVDSTRAYYARSQNARATQVAVVISVVVIVINLVLFLLTKR
jgi:hypothetical protein